MNPEIIAARKILLRAGLVILGIIALIIAYNILKNGRLNITFKENSGTKVIVIIDSDSKKELSNQTTSEDKFSGALPGGNYEVRIFSANDIATTDFVSISGFLKSTNINVEFSQQNSRTKVSRDVNSCPLNFNGTIYSYNCFGSDGLYRHSKLTKDSYPQKELVEEAGQYVLGAEEYKNGLIVLARNDFGDTSEVAVSYIDKVGKISKKTIPQEVLNDDLDVTLDVDSSGGDGFIVGGGRDNSVIYYAGFNSNPVQVKASELSDKISNPRLRSWDIRGDKILLAWVSSIQEDEAAEKVESVKEEAPEEVEYTLIKVDGSSQDRVNKKVIAGDVSFCGDNYICTKSQGVVSVDVLDGGKLNNYISISNVDEFIVAPQNNIKYRQQNKVFDLDLGKKSSHTIFSSNYISISTISQSKDETLINGFLVSDDTSTTTGAHTYLVTNRQSETDTFMDRFLPYRNRDLTYIRDSDYRDSLIVVDVSLDSWYSEGLGPATKYDKDEFNRKKKEILDDLESKGINKAKFNIVIKP